MEAARHPQRLVSHTGLKCVGTAPACKKTGNRNPVELPHEFFA
jgi:hypothetical protein